MDKRNVIGLFLIAIVLIVWQFIAGPSAEEIRQMEAKKDSIAQAEKQKELAEKKAKEAALPAEPAPVIEPVAADTLEGDSALNAKLISMFGELAQSAKGTPEEFTIETPLVKATFSNMGGRLISAELPQYHTYDTMPLVLFDKDSSLLDFRFRFQNRDLAASQLFFDHEIIEPQTDSDSTVVIFKAYAGSRDKYIEQRYVFYPDDYMADYDIRFVGMPDVVAENNDLIRINWLITSPRKEKGLQLESQKTTIFYRDIDEDVDYLSETKDDEELAELDLQWVAFKEQFFTVDLITPQGNFKANESKLIVRMKPENSKYVKTLAADLKTQLANGSIDMNLYLGPAKYKILKKYDIGLDKQIDLGWGIFGWVNRWLVIPVFDFLDGFHISYGLIILILTLFIKIILFPITYKTYLSSAKMKALKPEIEEINKKYEGKDAAEKQQAILALYRETGVNPMAGCIPMLIQLPILYAMFRFFPASIELRQQSFLWADDLSTYDVILDLSQWGIHIPLYGDHVSGFTLLMAISMIFYTKNNSQMNMSATSGPQAQQMKIMMWFMPIMMMVFLNNYPSGLSLYYFTANIVTMVQQWLIKKFFIDEEKIHAKLQANKAKPKKKSKFMAKMEALQEQQKIQQNRRMRRGNK